MRFLLCLGLLTAMAERAHADIRIATTGPMTGESAVFGPQMRAGAELAVADINGHGGLPGQTVKLLVEDDACDPKQAVAVANRLAGERVSLVAGHFCSSSSIPASKVYTDEGIIEITPSSASNRYTDEGAWNTFRVCGRDDQQGRFTGHTLATIDRDQAVAILHDNTTFGKGVADATKQAMNAEGKQEALYQAYTPGERDYTALVSRLKQAHIEVVYIGGYHAAIGLIVRQAREQGFAAQFLGSTTLQTKALWDVGGPAIEGFRHVFYADPRTLPSAARVVQALDDRKIEPEGFVLYTYAAVQVWALAAARAGTIDPRTVAATLRAGSPWQTVLGALSFDAKGDIAKPAYAWYFWHDGAYHKAP